MTDLEQLLKEIKNKKLLVVFPHPDDESFNAGGLIQRAKGLGFEVELLTLTMGGRGKNFSGDDRNLKEIRFEELHEAVASVGIDRLNVWDYSDGSLRTEKGWRNGLRKIIKRFKPGLVVTYDFSGLTGHPDHICLSRKVFEILKEELPETKLIWPIWPGILRRFMVDPRVREYVSKPTLLLKLSDQEHHNKCRAIKAHVSQMGNLTFWQKFVLRHFICKREYFALADFDREYGYKFVDFKF